MNNSKLKTAVRVILPLYLIVKIIAGLLTFLSFGAIDLTFFNPSIEMAFQVFIFFIKNTTTGLVIFITVIALTLFGTALGFFVSSDSKKLNIVGFFAYSVLLLTDIVSAVILLMMNGLFSDGAFMLSLILGAVMLICLLFYGKRRLLKPRKGDSDAQITDREDAENNP